MAASAQPTARPAAGPAVSHINQHTAASAPPQWQSVLSHSTSCSWSSRVTHQPAHCISLQPLCLHSGIPCSAHSTSCSWSSLVTHQPAHCISLQPLCLHSGSLCSAHSTVLQLEQPLDLSQCRLLEMQPTSNQGSRHTGDIVALMWPCGGTAVNARGLGCSKTAVDTLGCCGTVAALRWHCRGTVPALLCLAKALLWHFYRRTAAGVVDERAVDSHIVHSGTCTVVVLLRHCRHAVVAITVLSHCSRHAVAIVAALSVVLLYTIETL